MSGDSTGRPEAGAAGGRGARSLAGLCVVPRASTLTQGTRAVLHPSVPFPDVPLTLMVSCVLTLITPSGAEWV